MRPRTRDPPWWGQGHRCSYCPGGDDLGGLAASRRAGLGDTHRAVLEGVL